MRRIMLFVVGMIAAFYFVGDWIADDTQVRRPPKEKYRLVHAIGQTEHISARNLDLMECRTRRDELRKVALMIGTGGSITCLEESTFDN